MSSGSDTLSNREKYNQLLHSLEILDRSKWPKETDPYFGDKQVRELGKEFDACVSSSVHGFREYVISGHCDNFASEFLRPDRLWSPPSLLSNGTGGPFPGGKRCRGVMLTTHPI
jgi:hypothetical protein